MTYVAHFTDGSSSPLTVHGGDPMAFIVGMSTRDDGFKRVIFFTGDYDDERINDPWINRVTRLTASDVTREEK